MKTLSRRDLLKTSLLAPAAVAAQGMGPMGAAIEAISQETRPQPVNAVPNPSASGTYRERLLLDQGDVDTQACGVSGRLVAGRPTADDHEPHGYRLRATPRCPVPGPPAHRGAARLVSVCCRRR